MIARAIAAITAGAAAGVAIARMQRAPKPATRTITTYTEHNIAHIHATPAPVEPAHWMTIMTTNNAGIYTAYRRRGFDDEQAYGLLCLHIEGSYLQGRRG